MVTDLRAWLLDSDPALRWQVQRDLLGAPERDWRTTRARVATEGFGARLLALQDDDGQWAGGAFFPADAGPQEKGQPWTATTWSLNALREWGLDAELLRRRRTAELLAENSRWEYDDLPYWGGEVDCCINAWTIANGAWLGVDVSGLADWFVAHQLADGGWNCEWLSGAVVSSFHSTLNALKGLLAYEQHTGGSAATRRARRAGAEYLLQRHLFTRLSTGEPVGRWVDEFCYPPRWVYSVLNAADHFRAAAVHDGSAPDPRMAEAIERIRSARQGDGTWWQSRRHPGRVWFEVDVPAGRPSRWLTTFALRTLAWYDGRAVEL